jgi:hypothetical protein
MKITIRTNPEIVIEVDSIAEDKKVLPAIAVPAEAKAGSDAKPELKGKIEKRGKGVRHCKKCGETGHRSDHCPGSGGGTMKDKIRNLADEGLSSEEVADRLGLSVAVVNKYW